MSAFTPTSSGSDGATMHGEFMAFATDDASVATLRSFAERQGFPASAVQTGGPDIFIHMLEHATAPRLAIVDIDGLTDPATTTARLVGLCGRDCRIIAIGTANDVSLYRKIIASGVADYLVKPLTSETLTQTYATMLRGGASANGAREAKIIVMLGVRGGTGATTIAVNTGWLLAQKLKYQVALLDLDLQYGTSALALDLEPGRGLRDVVASPHRVDSLMVSSAMVAASDQFSVLGAEEPVEDSVPVDAGAIAALLKEMKGNFDFIVVDLPRHMLATQKRLLAMAHEIILVSELSLAGIRDTLRVKNALGALGGASQLTIITSRVSPSNPGQVDQAAFEKGAQIKVNHSIPEDQKSVALAANTGKALGAVAADAQITKALLALATKLSGKGADGDAAKGGLLKWIWGSEPAKAKSTGKGKAGAAKDKP